MTKTTKGRPPILPWEKTTAKEWQSYTDKEFSLAFAKLGLSCAIPNVFNRRAKLKMKAALCELNKGAIKYTAATFECKRPSHSRSMESNVLKLAEIFGYKKKK